MFQPRDFFTEDLSTIRDASEDELRDFKYCVRILNSIQEKLIVLGTDSRRFKRTLHTWEDVLAEADAVSSYVDYLVHHDTYEEFDQMGREFATINMIIRRHLK